MADPKPLLSPSTPKSPTLDSLIPSVDEMIERCTGRFGWAQLVQALVVSLAWVFDAQQTFITIFTDAQPPWRCTDQASRTCSPSANICRLPKTAWTWENPQTSSTLSEWSLECAGSVVAGLPASSFFMGCLLGGFALASFADSSLGRKNVLFLSCLTMSVSALLTAFSFNIWVYAVLRFVSGFGRASIGTCAFVLSTEIAGKRWRSQVGIVGFFCFALGFLSLPALAYENRDSSWRTLYLWTSVPSIFYCILVHFLVRESPRWLFMQGRKEEAMATLKKIACATTDDDNGLNLLLVKHETLRVDHNINPRCSVFKTFKEKKWALRRLLTVVVLGFGIGIVYYGMPLGVGNLAFNLYLSVTFNALSEVPSSLLVFFFIGKWKRRKSLLAFTSMSGICSVMCVVVGDGVLKGYLQVGLELASFFGACTAFSVLLIHTLELFPTCVRNSATSMVRQALVLGGVLSPMVIAAGRHNAFLSYGTFGVLIFFSGLFVVCLPETKGSALCDTMEEQERKETAVASDLVKGV
ncbi:organic cation/carnitine transporter 3-like [Malania oleifera]|uniref:organic cation/carnitine transporter 3-like n=1 Tax=Malania oleifera TaxID=397392 RepID=UPI0025AE2CCF|nr:organic cation/carnitine transporter 3-like [Malania oleifera]